jgi:glycosyltransferase involved in cell wall biosynthesis
MTTTPMAPAAPAASQAPIGADRVPTDLTIAIPALNEAENLTSLLPRLKAVLTELECRYEIIIIDGSSAGGTAKIASSHGAKLILQTKDGYGDAIREAISQASGEYMLTLDADLSTIQP